MGKSICGIDCGECPMNGSCKGCAETGGRPFGGDCVLAKCCLKNDGKTCGVCTVKERLIKEFNDLHIEGMAEVTDLNALCGSFVNLEYPLANGQTVKLLDDSRIYLGNQLCKADSDRCYGIVGDENYLLVCEYGENGAEPEIVSYKRR